MEDKKEKEADDSSWLTHELTFEVDPTKKVHHSEVVVVACSHCM